MPDHDGLMRIFWPADIRTSELRGVVVGWRNSALDVFVVTILEEVEVCGRQTLCHPGKPTLIMVTAPEG